MLLTLLHFNDLFDHHLPGPCGTVRGFALGPGTGHRLTEKGVRTLLLHTACLPLTSFMSGLGTGTSVVLGDATWCYLRPDIPFPTGG